MSVITDLHQKIIAGIKAVAPGLKSCEAYPQFVKKIATPAVLLEMGAMDPSQDPGTGELALDARFSVYVIVSCGDPDFNLATRELAAQIAIVVAGNRWGLPVGPARIDSIEPDTFKPNILGYEIWRVSWTHLILLGDSVWDDSGVTPSEIYLGYSPDIGFGHEDDYQRVE